MKYIYNITKDYYYFILSGNNVIEINYLSEEVNINDLILFKYQDKYIKVKITNKIVYKHNLKIEFEILEADVDILINTSRPPYIKKLTNDKIINLTGQTGSGKSTYAMQNFNTSEYEIVDTDEIFGEERFKEATGLNRELGLYFRNKYKELPKLFDNFDLIYKDILKYCKNIDKTIVIDCAQFHSIKNINILKGTIIILRTDINTCYKRVIIRWINNHLTMGYREEELNKYKERKKAIYTWYKYSNIFIREIDCLKSIKNV